MTTRFFGPFLCSFTTFQTPSFPPSPLGFVPIFFSPSLPHYSLLSAAVCPLRLRMVLLLLCFLRLSDFGRHVLPQPPFPKVLFFHLQRLRLNAPQAATVPTFFSPYSGVLLCDCCRCGRPFKTLDLCGFVLSPSSSIPLVVPP